MFRFESVEYLYFLAAIIPLSGLIYWGWMLYQKQASKIGDEKLIAKLTVRQSEWQQRFAMIILPISLSLLLIAWANPQWGAKREKVKTRSSDIFIALDISTSMYCQDIAPNRLEQARRFALELVDKLRGERIGLIFFAGNAYLQMPLTTDYAAAEIFIRSASPSQATTQGTAIGSAIRTAEDSFTKDNKFHKTLIVISDGEDHDAEAVEAAKMANEAGMIIFTVGVGTAQGSFIPITVRGSQDWKRDAEGQPVRTSLNQTLLKGVAESGGGAYYYLNNSDRILNDIDNRVENLDKQTVEERSFSEYESYFQIFLGLGLLGLFIHWTFANQLWSPGKIVRS